MERNLYRNVVDSGFSNGNGTFHDVRKRKFPKIGKSVQTFTNSRRSSERNLIPLAFICPFHRTFSIKSRKCNGACLWHVADRFDTCQNHKSHAESSNICYPPCNMRNQSSRYFVDCIFDKGFLFNKNQFKFEVAQHSFLDHIKALERYFVGLSKINYPEQRSILEKYFISISENFKSIYLNSIKTPSNKIWNTKIARFSNRHAAEQNKIRKKDSGTFFSI